jgi:hypothetical protein
VSRLLLVEGIPGAGKTTTARLLADLLRERGHPCVLFLEGDPQPADLCWQWWLSHEEFDAMLRQWPDAADTLRAHSWLGRAGVSVAYTKLDRGRFGSGWAEVERSTADREPFNGVVSPERFVEILATRWAEFGRDGAPRAGFVIFEAALLQDTIVELLLYAQWDAARVAAAVGRLLESVAGLSPVVLRLVPSAVAATVAAAAAERVDEHGHPWWHEGFRSYVAGTPWARSRGLGEDEAGLAFLRERLAMEDELRSLLPVTWMDVPSPAGGPDGWTALDAALAGIADRLVTEEQSTS